MKRTIALALVPLLVPAVSFGLTLEEAVKHVNSTNPVIIERVKNYEATEQDIGMAEAGYLPSLDLEARYGPETTDTSTIPEIHLKRYERGAVASINLFEGFGTRDNVDKQEARTAAAKLSVAEEVNRLSLETIEAYLELMKQHELLTIAQNNLQTHEEINTRINERTESGFGSKSEQDQSKGRLSLAHSNVIIQQSNFRDAEAKFTRVYGEAVKVESLVKPAFGYAIPVTLDSAIQQAQENHPAIHVQTTNIKVAKENVGVALAPFYPRLDAELSSYQNDNIGGIAGHHDTESAMLILSYNVFNGWYHFADKEQKQIVVLKEEAILNDLKRRAQENVNYAWIAFEELTKQIPHLRAHRDYSVTTLEAYNQEFSLGRRTLLDILNTENERTTAEQELITAEYDLLLAKYRILEGTGSLASSLNAEPAAK